MDARTSIKHVPLCVDLDGTLVVTDTLWEGLVSILLRKPYFLFHILFWILGGKAHLKEMVARHCPKNAQDWPIRDEVLDFIKVAKAEGRKIVLATGAPEKFALDVYERVGLFDAVFCSTPSENLTSYRKRDCLVREFGEGGFDYIGNSQDDIAVFEVARQAIVVAPDAAAQNWQAQYQAEQIEVKSPSAMAIFKAIRVHQWLKNTLIFVPLILNHPHLNLSSFSHATMAFFSFSFFASAVYLINDLSDLSADRAHAKKRFRPLANCDISIPIALSTCAALLLASFSLASILPAQFLAVLIVYGIITTAYTFFLKRKLLADVFTLAGLYTIRIVAGAFATYTHLSFWILAFSTFFFLSLALVKRFVEVAEIDPRSDQLIKGRGYMGLDAAMLSQGGVASAFTAALVLALYINSDEISANYAHPWMIWPLVPLILYMQLRIWILASRGQMHEDPVVFIMRDWRSQLTMFIGGMLILGAVFYQ